MKSKNKKITENDKTNKIITVIGLATILASCLANLFGFYKNTNFIQSPLDLIYYLRFIIILGGGFSIGFLLHKNNDNKYNRLFSGAIYSLLAFLIFIVLDIIRLPFNGSVFNIGYPFGKIIFEGIPLLSIIITLIIGIRQKNKFKNATINIITKATIISLFIIYQLYVVISEMIYLQQSNTVTDTSTPIIFKIISIVSSPIIISIITFFLLGRIKLKYDRIFYSTLIATIYFSFIESLWELRVDASADATMTFGVIVNIIGLFIVLTAIWQIRKNITS